MSGTHPALQALAALAATAAATGLAVLLDGRMSVAGLAMVYLIAVVVTALFLGRPASVATCLLCVSALNFFFVPPRHTFDVAGAEYWWTLVVLLGLSLALNQLIAYLREGRRKALAGEARAAQLHALGEALAACRGFEEMARRSAEWLHEQLGHPCAVFVRPAAGSELQCFGAPPQGEFHVPSAQWALDNGRPLGRGCDDWPGLRLWCAPFRRQEPTGCVQLLLDDAPAPTPVARTHWEALARQVGLSVERERADAAAREARESAQSEAARNTLLASLSHDLRTPLASIVGSASALRAQGEALSPAQRARLLENLENESRDLTLMADNVLQMARLSQPQWQLRTQWESVEEILGTVAARMRRRWGEARIQLRVAGGLPPVKAEAGLLAQVIANLVDNAVRHGGAEPRITVQAGRSREGVFIAVRDHGPGLDEAQLQSLFNRQRVPEGAGRAGGAGLGLAICRLIVQAHGGRMEARGCDPGLEFRIDLPAARQVELHE